MRGAGNPRSVGSTAWSARECLVRQGPQCARRLFPRAGSNAGLNVFGRRRFGLPEGGEHANERSHDDDCCCQC